MWALSNITAKNVLIQLAEEDVQDAGLKSKIDCFVASRKIDAAIMTVDGMLLFSSKIKLSLNSGVLSLQKAMGLSRMPTRLRCYDPLPGNFLVKYFSDGYDETKVYYTYGEKFTPTYINWILSQKAEREQNQVRNRHILSTSILNLVQDGTVTVFEVPRLDQGKTILERIYRDTNCNPDLEGPITLTFEKWTMDKITKCPIKTQDFPPVNVTIVGRPGQMNIKMKHYVIYSKLPGFGKTYQLKRLAEVYNVHFVNDSANWTTVPSESQFLVFDEVGYEHNKLCFENLKALTGGTADAFRGNCKTFGASFRPRDDVQVIMLSNRSPYEIYGKFNAVLKRRVMSKEQMEQFDDRFSVFCLDGSLEEDRVRASTADAWSESQFRGECKRIIENAFRSLRKTGDLEANVATMIAAVDMIVYLCRQKETENVFEVATRVFTVLMELDDDRFCLSLLKIFKFCYQAMAIKRKGRALAKAQRLLTGYALNEIKVFESFGLDELAVYIATKPSAAYRLFLFYTNTPYHINFNDEDQDSVFRACVSVHSRNPDDYELRIYKTNVFDRLWNMAHCSVSVN